VKIPFTQNVGTLDRIIRICIGSALIAIGVLAVKDTTSTILLLLSIVPLVSGITGFCPPCILLGISTKREK
jgi:hypothetical protein